MTVTRSLQASIIAALALVIAACNATTSTVKRSPARVEIQEAVGFTITEQTRIPGAIRADYESALALLQQGSLQDGIAALEVVVTEAPGLSAPRIDLGIAYKRRDPGILNNLGKEAQHVGPGIQLVRLPRLSEYGLCIGTGYGGFFYGHLCAL